MDAEDFEGTEDPNWAEGCLTPGELKLAEFCGALARLRRQRTAPSLAREWAGTDG